MKNLQARRNWKLPFAPLTSFAMLLSTMCLGLLSSGCTYLCNGVPLTPERTAFLKDGVTTRPEVVENFGAPTIESTNRNGLAYTWERRRDGAQWFLAGQHGDVTGGVARRWLFCIEFGGDQKVTRHETIRQESEDSATAGLENWLSEKQ